MTKTAATGLTVRTGIKTGGIWSNHCKTVGSQRHLTAATSAALILGLTIC